MFENTEFFDSIKERLDQLEEKVRKLEDYHKQKYYFLYGDEKAAALAKKLSEYDAGEQVVLTKEEIEIMNDVDRFWISTS